MKEFFAIAEALRRGINEEKIFEISKINPWFYKWNKNYSGYGKAA